MGVGDKTLTVSYPGTPFYNPSSGTGRLTVRPGDTYVPVASVNRRVGQTVVLRAALRRYPDNAYLVGRTLTFKIDGQTVGTAVIGADRLAKLNFTIPSEYGAGVKTITVEFAGEANYSASVGSSLLRSSSP